MLHFSTRSVVLSWVLLLTLGCSSNDSSSPNTDLQGDVTADEASFDSRTDAPTDAMNDSDSHPYPTVAWSWETAFDPSVEFRPWVRWWWPGADVDDSKLASEIQLLAQNGFGGAEIQPFNAALNPEAPADELARRLAHDTPAFWAHVACAMDAAIDSGLSLDLTLGSGWASGGNHISMDDSLHTLVHSEHVVQGPQSLTLALDGPDTPAFYEVSEMAAGFGEPLARYLPEEAELVAVVASRKTGGVREANPFVITDSLILDPASTVVLTDKVSGTGTLKWDVPTGEWVVVALFSMPDGEFPSLIAQPEPGFVVDHFNEARFRANLEHLMGERTGMVPYYGAPLRGFFNDSFELKSERFFTDDFLAQFKERRGYDATPYLPAMLIPGADDHIFDGAGIARKAPYSFGEMDERLQHDYALTASELFIERFVKVCADFADKNGLKSRAQTYGLAVDVIRASGESQIPEAEQLYAGGSDLFLKAVSAGGLWYNRPVISAESLVWAGRDHMLTPTKLRAAADKLFLAGINQMVYHGFPYQIGKPEIYGEQGWNAFSSPWSGMGTYSSNISPSNAYFEWFPTLNRYVARMQYFMRLGRPAVDAAVYYPWLGSTAALARMEDHSEVLFLGGLFDFEPPASENTLFQLVDTVFGDRDLGKAGRWMESLWPVLQAIHQQGIAWTWVNDDSLEQADFQDGKWTIRGNSFDVLVVADIEAMPLATAQKLEVLAQAGAPTVFAGSTPDAQPGFDNFEAGDAAVALSIERAKAAGTVLESVEELPETLAATTGVPSLKWTDVKEGGKVRFAHRILANGAHLFFIRNSSTTEVQPTFTVVDGCSQPIWLDVMNSRYGIKEEDMSVRLAPMESGILLCGFEPPSKDTGWSVALELDFDSAFEVDCLSGLVSGTDVANDEQEVALDGVGLWTDEALTFCSSPGHYELCPVEPGDYVIDFGDVRGIVVMDNPTLESVALTPPFRIHHEVTKSASETPIAFTLIPPLRNRLLGLGDSDDPRYVEFKGKEDTRIPVGIDGPIRLIPVLEK